MFEKEKPKIKNQTTQAERADWRFQRQRVKAGEMGEQG